MNPTEVVVLVATRRSVLERSSIDYALSSTNIEFAANNAMHDGTRRSLRDATGRPCSGREASPTQGSALWLEVDFSSNIGLDSLIMTSSNNYEHPRAVSHTEYEDPTALEKLESNVGTV